MPRRVDHEERRREIVGAVERLAVRRGLQGVSFREVAAEAGMSVSSVQHYFGTKANLLAVTLNVCSADMGQRALRRLADLGPDPTPIDRIGCIAASFLPTDDESRSAMLLYLGFAAAALTDESIRSAQAFADEANLRQLIAGELVEAQRCGEVTDAIDPSVEARTINSLVIGLSVAVLLGTCGPDEAVRTVESHVALLRG